MASQAWVHFEIYCWIGWSYMYVQDLWLITTLISSLQWPKANANILMMPGGQKLGYSNKASSFSFFFFFSTITRDQWCGVLWSIWEKTDRKSNKIANSRIIWIRMCLERQCLGPQWHSKRLQNVTWKSSTFNWRTKCLQNWELWGDVTCYAYTWDFVIVHEMLAVQDQSLPLQAALSLVFILHPHLWTARWAVISPGNSTRTNTMSSMAVEHVVCGFVSDYLSKKGSGKAWRCVTRCWSAALWTEHHPRVLSYQQSITWLSLGKHWLWNRASWQVVEAIRLSLTCHWHSTQRPSLYQDAARTPLVLFDRRKP